MIIELTGVFRGDNFFCNISLNPLNRRQIVDFLQVEEAEKNHGIILDEHLVRLQPLLDENAKLCCFWLNAE